jgi:cytochrome c-type biogenesis protein CcmH/NrfF
MTVLAHVGHWATQLIYLAPVLVIVVALLVSWLRDKRRKKHGSHGDHPQ